MENNQNSKLMADTIAESVPSKKVWSKPYVILIEKDIIEGQSNVGNDGGGVSTGS